MPLDHTSWLVIIFSFDAVKSARAMHILTRETLYTIQHWLIFFSASCLHVDCQHKKKSNLPVESWTSHANNRIIMGLGNIINSKIGRQDLAARFAKLHSTTCGAARTRVEFELGTGRWKGLQAGTTRQWERGETPAGSELGSGLGWLGAGSTPRKRRKGMAWAGNVETICTKYWNLWLEMLKQNKNLG